MVYCYFIRCCVFPLDCKIKTKYHTVKTVPKANRKILEGDNVDTSTLQIHDHLHFCTFMTWCRHLKKRYTVKYVLRGHL